MRVNGRVTRNILPENLAVNWAGPFWWRPLISHVYSTQESHGPPERQCLSPITSSPRPCEESSALFRQLWGQSSPRLHQRTDTLTAASVGGMRLRNSRRRSGSLVRDSEVSREGAEGIPGLCKCTVDGITTHQLSSEKTVVVKNNTAF